MPAQNRNQVAGMVGRTAGARNAVGNAMAGTGNVADIVRQVNQGQQYGMPSGGAVPNAPRISPYAQYAQGGGSYNQAGTFNPQQFAQQALGLMRQSNQPVQGPSVFAPPQLPNVPQTSIDTALNTDNLGVADLVKQAGGPPTVAGGPPVDPNYLTPAGSIENMLYQLFGGGAGGFQAEVPEFTQQLARGEIPTGTQAAFNDMWRQQAPRMLERMGGARFGTDALRSQGDTYMRGLNSLLAQSEDRGLAAGQQVTGASQNAINNWLGTGNNLFSSEQNRNRLGFQLLLQDLMRQSGIPDEITNLLGGGGGGGGNFQFPQETSTLGTILGAVGPMLGGAISGLPGLFGGGGGGNVTASGTGADYGMSVAPNPFT